MFIVINNKCTMGQFPVDFEKFVIKKIALSITASYI